MKKLIERRAGLAALLNSMLEAVKTENRAFTEEEAKKFDETEAEIKQLDATIKAEERAKNITELPVPQTAPKTEQLTQEQIEERAFADFINGKITEMRAGEQNIDWTNGASTVPTTIAKRIIDAAVDMCPILAGAEVYHEKGTLKIPKWTKANSTHDPAVAVTAGVVGLTAAITALAIASKEAGDNELSIADEVAKKYEEEHQAVDDLRSSMNSMKDDFNKRAGDIESESKRTEDLWKELDSLTDSTGKVQDADKKRAEYILGELNEALGQEYTMTGNQIDRYKEMEAEIDTLIEKKKAAAMLDSFIEQDAEYTKAQKEALEAYEQAGVKSDQAKIDLSGYFSQLKRRGIVSGNDVMSAGWLQDQINTQGVFYSSDKKEDAEIKELIRNYLTALAEYEENQNIMSEQQSNYQTAIEYQQKLHDAEAAYAQGNYSDVSNILYSSDNDAALLKAETDLDKRNAIFAEMLKKSRKGIELALKSDSEYAVKDAIEGLEKTVEAGQIASVDIGKAFKANFGDEVQTMLDKGWDISDLSSWAKNSGLKTGDVFKDDYRTVVQKQIDRGFDIRNLVIWGANSGATTGSNYDEKFEQSVQDALDNFYPDADALMDWAREKGMAIGEILGEKIGEYCIPDIADKIGEFASVTTISSAWDAQLAAQGRYRTGVRFMADGGYLRSGQAVVAEAGPELLEIMNGGVKVTPLTGTSRNTPVQNSGAGQKIVSITNKIYANITSKYDVRRLAEDLAAEERILETAKGL